MSANQKIRDRVRRLREMTVARGCTEAEALAAAEKAAQLMGDHSLTDSDIIMDVQSSTGGRGRSVRAKLWPVIAFCTNSAHIIRTRDGASEVEFLGRAPGPEIAVYLREVCEGAIDRAVREFKTGTFYRRRRGLTSKRAAVADFTDGMINRLRLRLIELFASVRDPASRTDAEQALDLRYPDAVFVKHKEAPLRHNEARAAGWRAGDKVTLAHGVNGTDRIQIGGGA